MIGNLISEKKYIYTSPEKKNNFMYHYVSVRAHVLCHSGITRAICNHHHGQSAGCVYYHDGGRPFKTSVAMIWSQDISFNSFVVSLLFRGDVNSQ